MSIGKQAEAEAGITKNYTQAQESSFRTQTREREKQLRIYGATEGIQSKHSRITYQQNFDRFLNKINIHDLQVLLDFSKNRPQIIKEMIVDYIRYLSEEREIRRDSIKTQIAPIIRFFRISLSLSLRNPHVEGSGTDPPPGYRQTVKAGEFPRI